MKKRILIFLLLFGRAPSTLTRILKLIIGSNQIIITPKQNSVFRLLAFLSCIFIYNIKIFAQDGEAVNEGILKIEPATLLSSESDFTNEQTGEMTNDGDFILKANFSNYGNIGFSSQQNGYTRFEGHEQQLFFGSKPFNLNNVLFQNHEDGVQFLLDNDMNIYGIADFASGIIDNTGYIGRLTFYENAESINTSNSSFVNGPVKKMGNKDFTFPVGKEGYYRWAKLSEITNYSAVYQITYFLQNSSTIHPHNNKEVSIIEIDDQEYWVLKQEDNDEEEIFLTLSWNEETTPPSIFEAASEDAIAIVRWDEQKQSWINEGGIVDRENKSVSTLIEKPGIFTLGRIDVLLPPCELIVYNAVTPNGDGINDYFRIEVGDTNCAKNLHVRIFNRWGVKVFETNNYGSNGNVFNGYSSGRMTLGGNQQLPSGTYYYILDYQYGPVSQHNQHRQAGYLHLSGN